MAEFEELRLQVTLVDNASAGLKTMQTSIAALSAGTTQLSTATTTASTAISGFGTQMGRTGAQATQLQTTFRALNQTSGQLQSTMAGLQQMAQGGLNWGTVIDSTWALSFAVKDLHGNLAKVSPAARMAATGLAAIAGAATIGAAAYVGYNVAVFRFARELEDMGHIARATGTQLQDVFALREHARRFGLEAENVTRHLSGMQEAMLQLSLPGSQLRFDLQRQGMSSEFIRRLMAEKDALKQAQLIRDEILAIERTLLGRGFNPQAAAAGANQAIRQLGANVEFIRRGDFRAPTDEERARLEKWEKQTKEVMKAWRDLNDQLRTPALNFLGSGLRGLTDDLKALSAVLLTFNETYPALTKMGEALNALAPSWVANNGPLQTFTTTLKEINAIIGAIVAGYEAWDRFARRHNLPLANNDAPGVVPQPIPGTAGAPAIPGLPPGTSIPQGVPLLGQHGRGSWEDLLPSAEDRDPALLEDRRRNTDLNDDQNELLRQLNEQLRLLNEVLREPGGGTGGGAGGRRLGLLSGGTGGSGGLGGGPGGGTGGRTGGGTSSPDTTTTTEDKGGGPPVGGVTQVGRDAQGNLVAPPLSLEGINAAVRGTGAPPVGITQVPHGGAQPLSLEGVNAAVRGENVPPPAATTTTAGGAGGAAALLAQKRAGFKAELDSNPETRRLLGAIVSAEAPGAGPAVVESLMNRTEFINAQRAKQGKPPLTLRDMIKGHPSIAGGKSFYGPIRSGNINAHLARMARDPAYAAAMNRQIDRALAGSNVIQGYTDQGSAGPSHRDPNFDAGGTGVNLRGERVVAPGTAGAERFNDWLGGRGTRQWREQRQREVAEADKRVGQTAAPPASGPPASGPPTARNVSEQGYSFPVEGGRIISRLGDRRSGGRLHRGLDIGGTEGSQVTATSGQTVREVGNAPSGYGWYVRTIDQHGREHVYAHLQHDPRRTHGLRPGTRLNQGQNLGLLGRTGNARSTPPHLHYEIRPHVGGYNQSLDPERYLPRPGQRGAPPRTAVPPPVVAPRPPDTAGSVAPTGRAEAGVPVPQSSTAPPDWQSNTSLDAARLGGGRHGIFGNIPAPGDTLRGWAADIERRENAPPPPPGFGEDWDVLNCREFQGGRQLDVSSTGRELDAAIGGEFKSSVEGSGKITVDVNAPRGTTVGAEAGGIFKQVEINRMQQMTPSSTGGEAGL